MRNPRRLTAAAILTLAGVIAPLSGQASDAFCVPSAIPGQCIPDVRYGACKYGTAGGVDRTLQICAKVTAYFTGFWQSRHLINLGGANVPSGSYQFTLTKLQAGITTVLFTETRAFSTTIPGGNSVFAFSVEKVSPALPLTINTNIRYTATTRLTIGTHTEAVVHQCTYPAQSLDATRGDWLGYCVSAVNVSPLV